MFSRSNRKSKGSAITEFGPSLFLFLIIIFFPLLDMLGMAAVYGTCWYANFMCCRELAVRREGEKDNVVTEVNTAFGNSGFSKFVGIGDVNKDIKHVVTYSTPTPGQQATVTCETTVVAKPFISVPVPLITAPGLNAPMTFTIGSQRPREVTN